jgi:uncharacterized protein (DUF427 family)
MALTIGSGPFGQQPAGRFSVEMPDERMLYVELSERWIRGFLEGETIVSSMRPRLVHESGRLPVLYFPRDDVSSAALRASERTDHDELKGTARFWSLEVGKRRAQDAAWSFDHPQLESLIAVRWQALDEWLEEDEVAVKHPRDPYHRVDVRASSRHVRVSIDGQTLAESRRTRILFEAGLPLRFYFPPEDVRQDAFVRSDRRTACAYKGEASYWSVSTGDRVEQDLAWTYHEPLHDAAQVRDMLAFYNERVDLDVEGERWERPNTPWSRPPGRGS